MLGPLVYNSGTINTGRGGNPQHIPYPFLLNMGQIWNIGHIQISASFADIIIAASPDNINFTSIYHQNDASQGTQGQDISPSFRARYLQIYCNSTLGHDTVAINVSVYSVPLDMQLKVANSHIILKAANNHILTNSSH